MSLDNLDGQITPNDLIDLGIATRDSNGRLSSGGSIPVVTGTAVNLQVKKMVVGEPGTSTASTTLPIKILTGDPATPTTLYAGDNSTGFWKSTDDGDTWASIYTTTDVEVLRALVLSTATILILTRDSTPIYHIWRSTDGGSTFTKVFDFNSGSLGFVSDGQPWVEDTDASAIYAAEYAPTNQTTVNLYKSTDDGATWSAVFTFDQGVIRHFHGVFIDPYVTSRVWVTIGDTGTQPRIGYSDDGGVSFTWITEGKYPESRAVGLIFDADYVYWCPDTPDQRAGVYRYNRTSGQVGLLDLGDRTFMTPFYGAVQFDGMFAYIGAAEGLTDGWTGDGYVYMLCGNATNWRHAGRWYGVASEQSVPISHTLPDADGAFWVCFQQLADSADFNNYINVKFKLESTPFIDAQPTDYHRDMLTSFQEKEIALHITGSLSATTQIAIPVPFDTIVTGAQFAVSSALSSDASNYWIARIDRFVAGSYVSTIAQAGGASAAWTAYKTQALASNNTPKMLKKGDTLILRVQPTGTPSTIQNPTVTVKLRRVASPTP